MIKYRHLFFDLDNTLYDFGTNSYLALEATYEQLNLLPPDLPFAEYFETYTRVNDALWALYREKKLHKEILRGKRHENSLSEFNIKQEIAPLTIDNLYLKLMTTQTELFPNTLEVLTELKKRGYHLHIITNGFKEVQNDKLINTGLLKFISNIYISEEIKSPKPSREIFEHAIKSSNARKKESLMIGDSWESDIVGAKNFGIDQVYFKLDDNAVDFTIHSAPTYTISHLNDLLTIL
jgi:putative hydrolase of the HAD superfamily